MKTYYHIHGHPDEHLDLLDALEEFSILPHPLMMSATYAATAQDAAREIAENAAARIRNPFIVSCVGKMLTSADGNASVFVQCAGGDVTAYAYVNLDQMMAFADIESLREHLEKEELNSEAARAATATRWSNRAKDWQKVIDDRGSYANHEDGYARFNAVLTSIMKSSDAPRCIDIGCGNGGVARLLAETGASHVDAVDNSAGMIAAAQKVSHPSCVTYRDAELDEVEKSAGYGVLASRGVVISHLPNQDVFAHLGEITRLSHVGSYAVFDFIQRLGNGGFPNAGEKNELTVEWVREAMRELGWVPVAQDGDDSSRVVVVAFHRPFADSVYFVTGNPMKLLEMRHAAKHEHLHGCNFDLPELKHDRIEQIAEDKARRAYEIVGRPVLCTDGGIFMDAYGGFPGPNSKQAATKLKPEGLLRLLTNVENRSGKRMNAAAFFDGETLTVETQTVSVRFAHESRGTYPAYPMDKILIPDTPENPDGLTYAEIPPEDRGRVTELPALAAFAQKIMAKAA